MRLIDNPHVIQWLRGDLTFLASVTKASEDAWGRAMLKSIRPDLSLHQQWTNRFGEIIVEEILGNAWRPIVKQHLHPDLETETHVVEVKTCTYLTHGTANEKILGAPFKYADVPVLYGKPLVIVCVGGAEHACRTQYGVLNGDGASQKQAFLAFYKKQQIQFVGATDLLTSTSLARALGDLQ